jgi:hypothetical protein
MSQAFLPAVVILAATTTSAAFLLWLFQASPLRGALRHGQSVNNAVLSVVAVMFALLSAFMASEVWQRRAQALAAVEAEAGALRGLLRVANAVGAPGAALHAAARDHARVVIEQDWPALAAGRPADRSAASTQRLYDLALGDPALLALPATAQALLRDSLTQLRAARTQRLRLGAAHIAWGNWAALGLLAFLAQTAVATIHVAAPRSMLLAMALFTAAVTVLLSMLALNDEPFFGFAAVTDAPYHKVLADFPARGG